ncbi:hypothetical protein [Gordonia iterans]
MAKTNTPTADQAAKAADAYAQIIAGGGRPTVRALAKEAGIAVEAARQWLAANRPAPTATPAPDEVLDAVRTAAASHIWPAALTAARDEISEESAAEIIALREAEADAATEIATLRAELTQAQARIAELEEAAETAQRDAEQRVEEAQARASEAEGRITAAEEAAAAATTSVDTVTAEADTRVQQAEQRAITAEKAQASAEAVAETLRVVVAGFQQAAGTASAAATA